MFARRRSPDAAYRRSQAITTLPFRPTAVARGLAMRLAGCGEDGEERRRLGQHLLDELSSLAGLPRVELVVADRAQVHDHDGRRLTSRTYGYYRCWFGPGGGVERARIRVYNRTAVRQKAVAPKVVLNTVLHEWVHHYDFAGLGLARSPHTAGFHARLRGLAQGLDVGFVLPPERDGDGDPVVSPHRGLSGGAPPGPMA